MRCPKCNHEWKMPGPQAGGRKGGKKGFAVKPLSAAARKRAWKTRKRIADLEDKLKHAERIGGFSFSPNAGGEGRGASPRTSPPHCSQGGQTC